MMFHRFCKITAIVNSNSQVNIHFDTHYGNDTRMSLTHIKPLQLQNSSQKPVF